MISGELRSEKVQGTQEFLLKLGKKVMRGGWGAMASACRAGYSSWAEQRTANSGAGLDGS
jgi:hypothetical protein